MLRPDYSKSVEGNTKRQRKHNPTDSDLKGNFLRGVQEVITIKRRLEGAGKES